MPNLDLELKKDPSIFRRIAVGTWRTAYDPSVYGTMELPMDKAMDYIQRYRKATGKRLTVTHLIARAIAETMLRVPDANAILRFNKIYRRKSVGVFMQVVMTDEGEDKIDLSGVTIHDVEKKSLNELVDEVQQKVDKVRARTDEALEKSRGLFTHMPAMFVGWFLRLISFLSYTLNLDMRWAGIPKDAFGSVMITNVGSLGLDQAYAPLVPYSRVGLVIAAGAVREMPVAENGELLIRQQMKINATFDHRFIDGYHAAVMCKTLRQWMGEPDKHFGEIAA